MAPMTRRRSPGGVPTAEVAQYYADRAEHIGLIVTEGAYIDEPGAGMSRNVPWLFGEGLAGWRPVIEQVHARGSKIVAQAWHLGVVRRPGSQPFPEAATLSPSGISLDGDDVGAPASSAQLEELVASYGRAGAAAKELGFDGIELHGAHGYVLDQFLWERTNRRTDQYGGSAPNRARLAAEAVSAIRAAAGPDFPIFFRFSQWKAGNYDAEIFRTPQDMEDLLGPIVAAGVDVLHASTRRYATPAFAGSDLTLAGWAKKLFSLPTIGLGSIGVPIPFGGSEDERVADLSLGALETVLARGDFDVVALGRAVLSDPAWTQKLQTGRSAEIRHYLKEHEDEPLV